MTGWWLSVSEHCLHGKMGCSGNPPSHSCKSSSRIKWSVLERRAFICGPGRREKKKWLKVCNIQKDLNRKNFRFLDGKSTFPPRSLLRTHASCVNLLQWNPVSQGDSSISWLIRLMPGLSLVILRHIIQDYDLMGCVKSAGRHHGGGHLQNAVHAKGEIVNLLTEALHPQGVFDT